MQGQHRRPSLASKKSLLEVRNISQRYQTGAGEPGPAVLDDISLDLKEDEIVGLPGRPRGASQPI
jgi:NitT/TauT family transport system ATP-binding protein